MKKITLDIDGMMCGMCESHINDAVRNAFPVKKVTSSHTKNQTVIIMDSEPDLEKLKQVINDTGYTLTGMEVSDYEKKGLFSKFKKN